MIALMLSVAWATTDEEELPDPDLEIVRNRAEIEAAGPANRGRVGVVGGAGSWHVPAAVLALQLQVHVSEVLALSFEGGSDFATVLEARDAGRTTVALPSLALGLALDPSSTALKPQAALEATGTLYRLVGIAPGVRFRVGVDAVVAGPMAFALDAHAGLKVAPGLSDEINPRWSDVAPAVGARAGMVLRW